MGIYRKLLTLGCVLVSLTGAMRANPGWTKLTSQHFELYTDDRPEKVADILRQLERTRSLYYAVSLTKKDSEFPVRVVVFRSEKEFKHYTFESFAVGFYVGGMNRDYIVMENENIDIDRDEVIDHEYAHYLLSQQRAHSATWMDEGLADLFSSVKATPNGVVFGLPVEPRVETLRRSRLMPLSTILNADRKLLSMENVEGVDVFYAESWALAHMLRFSPKYSAGFEQVCAAIREGEPSEAALTKTYGRSEEEIAADFAAYIHDGRYSALVYPFPQPNSNFRAQQPAASVTELSDRDSTTVLADLLGKLGRFSEAFNMLSPYMHDAAENPQVDETMAYLYFQQRRYSDAASFFSQAAANGSDNPRLYYDYVRILLSINGWRPNLANFLRKALELKPDYEVARDQLTHIEHRGTAE